MANINYWPFSYLRAMVFKSVSKRAKKDIMGEAGGYLLRR